MQESSPSPLNQQAYDQLLDLLLQGKLGPGTQLDELLLSAELGISRTPLRSAINQLARDGLVEYVPYRGNFVRKWSLKEIEDLFQVRIALEMLAVRLAIPKLSNEDIDEIGAILDQVDQTLLQEDLPAYAEADRRFHRYIIDKTGNRTLIDTLERMSLQIQMIRTFANQDPDVVERTRHERPRILEALSARNADSAAHLMQEHIDGVRRTVIRQLDSSRFNGKRV